MTIKFYHSLKEISADQWQALEDANFPFADYEFLRSMEASGCVGVEPGWRPCYLTLWQGDQLRAATYLYKKTNSEGEFIFDWDWAEAYRRQGLAYYPKLLGAVPFTPATGPKFLFHPKADRQSAQKKLIKAALEYTQHHQWSGLHYLFLTAEELTAFEKEGFFIRHSYQFHWTNLGFKSFEDFEKALKRKRRQQTKKERETLAKSSLKFVTLRGEQIQEEHMEAMYQFYYRTHWQRGMAPYLNPECFSYWREHFKDRLVLMMAQESGQWIAGSINFIKGHSLFGRYWGAIKHVPYLHFELCYYRNIELAINLGLEHFEAGAQGGHKWYRGLVPELTYSAHWIGDPWFAKAIGRFIEEEKKYIAEQLKIMGEHSPYK